MKQQEEAESILILILMLPAVLYLPSSAVEHAAWSSSGALAGASRHSQWRRMSCSRW
jgi:hypothetical protein